MMRGGGTAGGGKRSSNITFTRQVPKFLKPFVQDPSEERASGDETVEATDDHAPGIAPPAAADDEFDPIEDMRKQGFNAEVLLKDGAAACNTRESDALPRSSRKRMAQVGGPRIKESQPKRRDTGHVRQSNRKLISFEEDEDDDAEADGS